MTPEKLRHLELVLILGSLTAFVPLSIDMYLPALPTLTNVFSASMAQVQLTLTTFFIGIAIGQAFYGPIADRFGRKPPLYVSLSLFVAASIGCALAPSVKWLAAMRFLQALGACAGGVISRAMVRDLFPPSEMRRVYSTLILVMGAAPMLAPFIGGYLLKWINWQAIFITVAIIGFVVLMAVWRRLKETHAASAANTLQFGKVLRAYGGLLIDRRFSGRAFAGAASIGGMFAYIAGSPFVFIELYGVSKEHFGWVFGINASGFILASQVNGRLLHARDPLTVIRICSTIQFLASIAVVACAATGLGGLYALAASIFVYIACLGFILPNTTSLAMAPFARSAGTASALLGTIQFGLGGITAGILAQLEDGTAKPMGIIIAVSGTLGLIMNWLPVPKEANPDVSPTRS